MGYRPRRAVRTMGYRVDFLEPAPEDSPPNPHWGISTGTRGAGGDGGAFGFTRRRRRRRRAAGRVLRGRRRSPTGLGLGGSPGRGARTDGLSSVSAMHFPAVKCECRSSPATREGRRVTERDLGREGIPSVARAHVVWLDSRTNFVKTAL